MKKLKEFLNRYRHILAMLCILCVSAVVFGWVGYASLPDAAARSEREIVNDDYSVLTQDITERQGIKQNIFVKGGTKLYGISANFHIFNRVQHGTVFVNVEDTAGNILASSSRDMTTVLDNTFKGFIFDNMLYSAEDADYVLHIGIQPQTAEDRVALWKSEKDYEGFALEENGREAAGAIALQYYTRHVGSDAYGYFALIAAIAVAGLELAYVLIFIRKAKIHNIFAVLSITIGMLFCLFTPVNGGPDEYVHFASSYKISSEMTGGENIVSQYYLRVRECDTVIDYNAPVDYNPFSFQNIFSGLGDKAPAETEYVNVKARFVAAFPLLYLVQALGISAARLLGLGFIPLFMMGRFFNLLAYTAVIWLAIKLMPVHKTTMALCALLPMSMQLAASYSYDTYIIAVSLLFIASVFRLAYGVEKIAARDMVLPLVTLCLLAPAKTIYIVTGALLFIIPDKKFGNRAKAWAAKLGIIAVAAVFWLSVNANRLGGVITSRPVQSSKDLSALENKAQTETVKDETAKQNNTAQEQQRLYPFDIFMAANPRPEEDLFWDPEGDLQPNGDSKYYFTLSYILSNLKQTVKLVINTVTQKSGHILQCLIGTRLGEIIVVDLQASWLWLMAFVAVLLLSVTRVKDTVPVHTGIAKWWGMLIFLGITALTVLAAVMWTPVNYETVFGLQGRYLLPPLVLAVMFFENKWLTLERNIDRELIFSVLCLNIMVILDVFIQIAAR